MSLIAFLLTGFFFKASVSVLSFIVLILDELQAKSSQIKSPRNVDGPRAESAGAPSFRDLLLRPPVKPIDG